MLSMKFKRTPALAFSLLLSVLLLLGFWQLHRAEEKRELLAQEQRGSNAETMQLTSETGDDLNTIKYKTTWAEGHYELKHQFLLDNQIKDGKAGYFVLTPFILKNGTKAVLVNRGWLPLGSNRTQLPDVTIVENQSVVKGKINGFPSVGIKLPGAEKPLPGWPSVVQVADSKILSDTLGYPLFPFLIELDEKSPEGYRRDWQPPVVMLPQQHVAYAFQWFGLALTLSVLFFWYSRAR